MTLQNSKKFDVYFGTYTENTISEGIYHSVLDAETGELVLVDTSSGALRRQFRDASNQERDQLLKMFRKNKIDHIELSTDRPYLNDVRQLFRRRQLRARRG
jgi:6-phosphogluconolactonase (cycloisomerase 2 family)